MSMRTHAKALILPAVVLIVLAALGGFLTADPRRQLGGAVGGRSSIWAAVAIGMLVWSVPPFIRWLTTEYTVTSKRVLLTSGVFTRKGRAIPLYRINDVTFEKGLLDRMLGCGTLVVSDASEQTGMRLTDVPRIEWVHRQLDRPRVRHQRRRRRRRQPRPRTMTAIGDERRLPPQQDRTP